MATAHVDHLKTGSRQTFLMPGPCVVRCRAAAST